MQGYLFKVNLEFSYAYSNLNFCLKRVLSDRKSVLMTRGVCPHF